MKKLPVAVLCALTVAAASCATVEPRASREASKAELVAELLDPRCVENGEELGVEACHLKLIDECGGQLAWSRGSDTWAMVFKVVPGGRRPVDIRCLFPAAKRSLDFQQVLSPSTYSCSESCGPQREGLMQVDDGLLILVAPGSDYGVGSLRHLGGDEYVFQAHHTAYTSNHGFKLNGEDVPDYPDGDVKYLDYEAGVYQVDMKKHYWKTTGAFWISVIYDKDHEILDIPPGDESEEYVVCVPRDVFIECTMYTEERLSNVTRDKICTWGGAGPDTPCSEWAP
jgi:hypothetical protein